ncbi:MAG: UDP-glucose 4-epimerase GalE, partial [Brucellaceae bacterium]|nr:UDP-glucose 4-epimerase GalE [Brucellaceae bacterium]
QILDGLAEVAGRPVPVTIAPRRPGDPPALVADPSRARALLAFEPGHSSVRSILSTAFSWHESHPA